MWLVALAACGDPSGLPELPDLALDRDTLATDLSIETRDFGGDACELTEVDRCVGGTGERRLLRFSVSTMNVGTADLVLGDPAAHPGQFEFSSCHGHHHLVDYASYELLAPDGSAAAIGHKQAFCLRDSIQNAPDPDVPSSARYDCNNQGLQQGWADLYDASVACQWIDVTGVAEGDYELVVRANPAGLLDELALDNNEERVPVRIGAAELESPTEACDLTLDADALAGTTRECGWTRAADWECIPGTYFAVGCGSAEGEGACSGQPTLRVCDADAANCTAGASLARVAPGDAACPRIEIIQCPDSGRVAGYTGSLAADQESSCEVAFAYL